MTSPFETLLTPHQRAVMDRAIAEEEARRRHLVISLSGAHAYGFPSPDSDLDLKAIHIDPTASLLGIGHGTPVVDRLEKVEGVEIDYTSNEIRPVLLGVLQGNGNYIERILGALQPLAAPELAPLRPLVTAALSRRIFRHYQGFAKSQLAAAQTPAGFSAKKLLYVLRTALTGAHALLTGRMVIDLGEICDEHGFGEARALIEAKRAGEAHELDAEAGARWASRVTGALDLLREAYDRSPLPEEPRGAEALEAWLIEERRKRF